MRGKTAMKTSPGACPICGDLPTIEKVSLDRGNGHGYPGCFMYVVCCECGHMKGGRSDTVYHGDGEAKQLAIDDWNCEVESVEKLMKQKSEREEKREGSRTNGN